MLFKNFRLCRFSHAFRSDARGGTATLFALAMVPMTLIIGASIDYAQGLRYSTKLKTAADSAALAAALVTSDPANPYNTNLTAVRLAAAQAAFNANIISESGIANQTMSMVEVANGVTVQGAGVTSNMFGGLLGNKYSNLAVTATATTNLVSNRMEVAFVLDNTGSMAVLNKMPLLKSSMQKFLAKLQAGVNASTDVKVALVPFDTNVKIDPVFAAGKPWIRQALPNLTTWTGCVMDRVQPYDTIATTPTLGAPNTLFDAVDGNFNVLPAWTTACNLPPMMTLTSNFTSFSSAVNAMAPSGNTNGTIGLAWGLQMLTPGEPFSAASAFGGGARKIMVFLTDGANTRNRWTSIPADIDARMLATCAEIRNKGVELYAIGLVDANMSVLNACATNPGMAFQVTDPTKIPDLFDLISQKYVGVRLTK